MPSFTTWISASKVPFFPEYTDHGISHIESVLDTAVGLMTEDSWEVFSATDAAVLILSVLLHDSAMHLSEEGFLSLLKKGRSECCVPDLNDPPWANLWQDFLAEARRFDRNKLQQIFGTADPITPPSFSTDSMTKRDRLLIGEFLRRHHPRLAQEIAHFGVPSPHSNTIQLNTLNESNDHIRTMIGLVARSHGQSIRSLFPFIKSKLDLREYKGGHVVYLITLLRIADYLKLESDRAPSEYLKITRLSSPASVGEWKAHSAITDIRTTHEDPEAVYIDATPSDQKTLAKIRSWLNGIQQELDVSWAVLGEVYGRFRGLNKLGLQLRRVRSSLDNLDSYSEKTDFFPIDARFRAADADLLKLLTEPLYGNRPEVGIRELTQNAVDAVRERLELAHNLTEATNDRQSSEAPLVSIKIEKLDEQWSWVTIEDNGIGMTPSTIVDYFLTAGASYRRSDEWRKQFENIDGNPRLIRTGRFGIGALAAFLLGPEIEVATRHASQQIGVLFTACIDSDLIELKKVHRPVGTTIRIRITTDLAGKFEGSASHAAPSYGNQQKRFWDWYCLKKPQVARSVFGVALKQTFLVPDLKDSLDENWIEIPDLRFDRVMWSYKKGTPELAVNGFVIQGSPRGDWEKSYGLTKPHVSVFDSRGLMPLNLQRTNLTQDSYPFEEALLDSVMDNCITKIAQHSVEAAPNMFAMRSFKGCPLYPGLALRDLSWNNSSYAGWYFTGSGWGLVDSLLQRPEVTNFVCISAPGLKNEGVTLIPHDETPMMISRHDSSLGDLDNVVRKLASPAYKAWRHEFDWSTPIINLLDMANIVGVRILLSELAHARAMSKTGLPKRLLRKVHQLHSSDGWHIIGIGDHSSGRFDFEKFLQSNLHSLNGFTVIGEFLLSKNQLHKSLSPLSIHWQKLVGNAVIPYKPSSSCIK
ncbi:ATP-binding protein [Verrucomicrobium sp. BvORR034]|uniref:HD domain-containing protein n=1 Tax=Verrucomicrobium sp. BvORR034 TaxID=1396418 RepID=UPI002240FBCD|nr:ATP-binding protein [Verrucomicrobium sp. BvORR034]